MLELFVDHRAYGARLCCPRQVIHKNIGASVRENNARVALLDAAVTAGGDCHVEIPVDPKCRWNRYWIRFTAQHAWHSGCCL